MDLDKVNIDEYSAVRKVLYDDYTAILIFILLLLIAHFTL